MKNIVLPIVLSIWFFSLSCNSGDGSNNNQWNSGNNTSNEICDNGVDDDGDNGIDCNDSDCWGNPVCKNNNTNNTNNVVQLFTLKGKIWAPGGDDPQVLEENKVPVPQAMIAAYTYEPDPPQTGVWCNQCVEIPSGIVHTFSDSEGYFEIGLHPNTDYWIVVQKGEFRRVTQYIAGDEGLEENVDVVSGVRNPMVTLPNKTDPTHGSWIPKILIIKGQYEDMHPLWAALGFNYGVDVTEVEAGNADTIIGNMTTLMQYNLIITTCGEDSYFLTDSNSRSNLRSYVEAGGKLYVDDFSYDYAEQPFPEFLTFENDSDSNCGSGSNPPGSIGDCNHWSEYDPVGTPGDPYFEAWLEVINPGGSIQLQAAWDIISGMNANDQGECSADGDPNCVNGHYVAPPKVWMYGDWPGYTHQPVTVSWNYYCGKVLYTVYHTHSGSGSADYSYPLILQEKIMLYLIMEIQTCTKPDIVE